MNLKIEIKIINTDNDEVIWSDFCSGDSKYQRGMFESAEMSLGKMERHLSMVLARDYGRDFEEEGLDESAREIIEAKK